MKLLNSQKNIFFELIEKNKTFSVNQFTIEEFKSTNNNWITTIKFKNPEYYFSIFEDSEAYGAGYVNYTPGINKYLEISSRLGFESAVIEFEKWLKSLQREISEPDLWEKLKTNIDYFSPKILQIDNSKFTAKEYIVLQQQISSLIEKVNQIPLLIEQQEEINRQLERLTLLAVDLGKFDWTNLFMGTIVSIIIQLGVNKENANLLWLAIKQILNNYFIK